MSHFILTDDGDSEDTVGVFDSFEAARDHAEKIAPADSRESAYTANVIEQWVGTEIVTTWQRELLWHDEGTYLYGGRKGYYAATPGWKASA